MSNSNKKNIFSGTYNGASNIEYRSISSLNLPSDQPIFRSISVRHPKSLSIDIAKVNRPSCITEVSRQKERSQHKTDPN